MIAVREHGLAAADANLKRASEAIPYTIASLVKQASLTASAHLRRAMSAPEVRDPFWGKQPGAGGMITVRTGHTRAGLSPGGVVYRTGTVFHSVVAHSADYMERLERGGTVEGSPLLRVPTAAAQTPGGADRWAGRSARTIKGAFIWPPSAWRGWAARPKGLWIARNVGKRLEMLYLLVRRIVVRPRGMWAATTKTTEVVYGGRLQSAVTVIARDAS